MKALHNIGDKVRTKKVRFIIKDIQEVDINGDKKIVYYVNSKFYVKAKDVITAPTNKVETKKVQKKIQKSEIE